jgi:SAM-dependent methyltransferase
MGDAGEEERGTSFGSNAAAYTEHRPDYPREAVEWALEPVKDRPGLTVLDLGAGTGQLTKGILATGAAVFAVEPDARMRAEHLRNHPEAKVLDGSAESMPLPDGSVDAVLAGNAFHWFDQERAFPEIARVLRPGGIFSALWNDDDEREDLVAGLAAIFGWKSSKSPTERVSSHPLFSDLKHAEFRYSQRRTVESMTLRMGTLSPVLAMPEATRVELLGRVRQFLTDRPETASGEFDLPIRTTVTRAELLG